MQDKPMAEQVEGLGRASMDVLRAALTQTDYSKGDVIRLKAAQVGFAGWTRFRATESARESNMLMMIREVAQDKEQFREFVKIGMPNAPILKALPRGK